MSDEILSDALAREVLSLGTATLYEASKLNCALTPAVQAAWPGSRVVGRALPVRSDAGDNLPLHRALAVAGPGDVLVIDAAGGRCGYWGEVMTVAALARGIAGLVINGCVRDIDAIQALGFPVFAIGRSIVRTRKDCLGVVAEPIDFVGVTVRPGDLVVGDADGVVVLPHDSVDDILATSRQRAITEEAYMQRLRDGDLTIDIYNLRGRGA
jgi:4-hydroxy-4-methyl-2-oxoglutarate aldolase